MPQAKIATVEFALAWRSPNAGHIERIYFDKISFWRDFFPGTLGEKLGELGQGGSATQSFPAGELVALWSEGHIHRVRPEQIHLQLPTGMEIPARAGRFYPRGMVEGLPDVFRGDRRPLRYLGESGALARVDLNHPLAHHPLTVTGKVLQSLGVVSERGGRSHDVAYAKTMAFSDPVFAVWVHRYSRPDASRRCIQKLFPDNPNAGSVYIANPMT